jgi:Lon-like ATP-dependent protease
MMKRGQPYLGAFLLKDENVDSDIITDLGSVHPVGVFAQITSVFSAAAVGGAGEGGEGEGLTAVLYPHRRIRITELVKAGGASGATVESAEDENNTQTITPPPSPEPTPEPTKLHPGSFSPLPNYSPLPN